LSLVSNQGLLHNLRRDRHGRSPCMSHPDAGNSLTGISTSH